LGSLKGFSDCLFGFNFVEAALSDCFAPYPAIPPAGGLGWGAVAAWAKSAQKTGIALRHPKIPACAGMTEFGFSDSLSGFQAAKRRRIAP